MKKLYILFLLFAGQTFFAQTEIDGIMMDKKQLCTGFTYECSSWSNYWEGTYYRENLSMGTVSTQKTAINANYGLSDKLNIIVSLPYVTTKASAGTMIGQKGMQDAALTVKYMPYEKSFKNNTLSFYVIGTYSFPTSNYVADYLPLSLGLHSKVGLLRLLGDYQFGSLFSTFSGAYAKRSNITIDRNTYYSDQMHYTNEVNLPDAITFNARFGYRTDRLIAEAVFDTWTTQKGGFDITTNNIPFPSNTMNMTKIGFGGKYYFSQLPGLSFVAAYNHVTNGRNVGQSNSISGGLLYILDFKTTKNKTTTDEK
jgi:Membrane bound beta barrel domain (DUF5777)